MNSTPLEYLKLGQVANTFATVTVAATIAILFAAVEFASWLCSGGILFSRKVGDQDSPNVSHLPIFGCLNYVVVVPIASLLGNNYLCSCYGCTTQVVLRVRSSFKEMIMLSEFAILDPLHPFHPNLKFRSLLCCRVTSCPIVGTVTGTLTIQAGASLVAIHAALNLKANPKLELVFKLLSSTYTRVKVDGTVTMYWFI